MRIVYLLRIAKVTHCWINSEMEYSFWTQVWFSNRRAKWRREEKLRTQRRPTEPSNSNNGVSGGGGGGGSGTNVTSTGNGSTNGNLSTANSNAAGNTGTGGGGGGGGGSTSASSPSLASAASRLPLNSGFNSMYTSIPQPIATITDNYR